MTKTDSIFGQKRCFSHNSVTGVSREPGGGSLEAKFGCATFVTATLFTVQQPIATFCNFYFGWGSRPLQKDFRWQIEASSTQYNATTNHPEEPANQRGRYLAQGALSPRSPESPEGGQPGLTGHPHEIVPHHVHPPCLGATPVEGVGMRKEMPGPRDGGHG